MDFFPFGSILKRAYKGYSFDEGEEQGNTGNLPYKGL